MVLWIDKRGLLWYKVEISWFLVTAGEKEKKMFKNGEYQIKISKHLLIVLALFITSTSFAATYGGGTGEPNNPYQIWTAEQMNTIGTDSNDWSKCFILMDDVNMAAYTGMQYNIIGNSTTKFTGKFNGNNHIIRNLKYSSTTTDYVGLFGYTDGSEIKNLNIEDVNIAGKDYVGGLIAHNMGMVSDCCSAGTVFGRSFVGGLIGVNNSIVENCSSSGFVKGIDHHVGGLIGDNFYKVINCYFDGFVRGFTIAGGLIGRNSGNDYVIVANCYSTGTVFGQSSVGGLIGSGYNININNCYSTADVSGEDEVGGFIGRETGKISNCYSTGSVNGTRNYIGGLIGVSGGEVNFCYSISDVNGKDFTGGLIGINGSHIKNCYSSGNVAGENAVGGFIGEDNGGEMSCYSAGSVLGISDVGGFIGDNYSGKASFCYSSGDVSGVGNVGGFVGNNEFYSVLGECYSTGNVSGNNSTGGLVGLNNGGARNCYSTGIVAGTAITIGGLIGDNRNIITACFWDVNSSGKNNAVGSGSSDGINGKTTEEMQTKATFADAGWDFVGASVNGKDDYWRMCVDGVSYPKFKWQFAKTDYTCPDGVNFLDYAVLAIYWLKDGDSDSRLDLTDDRHINLQEYSIIAGLWRVTGCGECNEADYSKDGDIDEDDLLILSRNWLRTDYGDVGGIDMTGDDKVDYEELKILAQDWLQ
jgi:hypothetical protein